MLWNSQDKSLDIELPCLSGTAIVLYLVIKGNVLTHIPIYNINLMSILNPAPYTRLIVAVIIKWMVIRP